MALKSAIIWGASQTIIRMALSFISIKVTAVFLGPEGLGLTGQLNNFISLVQGAIGNAIQTGVVKFTAEAHHDQSKLSSLWSTAVRLSLGISAIAALIIILACVPIARWLLRDTHYWPVIICAGLAIPLIVVSTTLNGILNGLKKINVLGKIAIASTLLGACIFIPLSYFFHLNGGLAGTVASCASIFLIILVAVMRSSDIKLNHFLEAWNTPIAKSLISFYPMLLVHAVAEPLTPLLVRNAIGNATTVADSGLWQATIRLSDLYTMLLTTALSMYLMPHLSAITDKKKFGRELLMTVIKVTLLTLAASLSLYLLRDLIISIVFTNAFQPVRDLLPLQLIGDVLKMAGWPLRMALVIKMRSYTYMLTEIGITVLQVAATYLLLPSMGIKAATAAYAITWGVSLIVLLLVLKEYWRADHQKL